MAKALYGVDMRCSRSNGERPATTDDWVAVGVMDDGSLQIRHHDTTVSVDSADAFFAAIDVLRQHHLQARAT